MSTNDLPQSAGTVIIGAGIVGSSLAGELAERGRDDILLIDKGPLSDPGGSTGHASNFIFPVDHSKDMTKLTSVSRDIYRDFDTFTNSGGIEVARTEERMEELKRRVVSAKSFGEEAELLTPEEVEELVPYLNTDIIKGGFYSPGAGTCDPLRAGELYRQQAKDKGALSTAANTEVTDLHVEDGDIQAVETDAGTVAADEVIIAAGLWSPKIAEMAGVDIPLSPAVHQMVSVGPIERFEDGEGEINYPVVRDMDTQMYERQHGNDIEVGSYEHRPILWDVDDVPSIEEAPLSPTQPPLTEDAFEQSMEHALEIIPDVLDDPDAGIRHSIDGLLSVTPDGHPLLGPIPEVDGLWSCAAIWIKEAPAIAREVSKWMTKGHPDIDIVAHDHVARFDEYGETREFVKSRGAEGFQKTYGIVHPREQWQSTRPLRTSAFYNRQEDLDAEFFEAGGWERPRWYESNADLVEKYSDEIEGLQRPNEWDSRWWSDIILGEHLHMRDNVGMIGDTGFGIFDIVGDDAMENMQQLCVAEMDVDVGESAYTPVLAPNAGFVSDLTVARIGENHYRVITGGAHAGQDKTWFQNHLEGDVELIGRSSELATLGVWGPNAQELLNELAEEEMSTDTFDFAEMKEVTIGPVRVQAFRISYVGEYGWELYVPMDQGQKLWDTIYEAGQEYDIRPVGTGVYGETGRMEKSYRLMGAELEIDYNPAEAGLTFHGVKDADFVGKEAYVEAIEAENAATLCTLSVTDHAPDGGEPRFMTGGEPILDQDGDVLIDDEGRRSYVTSAGTGPSVGKHLLLSYLPQEYANEGEELQVEYFGQHYPVEVEVVGHGGVFDPEGDRLFRNDY
ncbi:GcvT family protein [Halobellus clavatus]|jgi:glycine cleavage system aminomethyltransferase T/glycine/D-amino acid oxidase-like deaminating enzyme|uniref:Glycine cleavage system T protein (Aminomethyltransferase) n=1 Tax=Halobellus clavatus TaxID=660517 RepID=A0A1H3FQ67_9EURY|nr:FAD-dependent oxidoreductase [Halobellus clavatus]SDX93193.1 Glycine cleavage system T protein (aminomethyltransferase) [Halobellus clavatus]